ncbi:ferritin-like domain-containing protein [Streptomyces sp. NPDC021020]|uniref:ferritin-like domain-containing protein n=1 Tax=Streptomyces sp. NPDC021020 TaxID=3365109 RepID=UPI0037B14C28
MNAVIDAVQAALAAEYAAVYGYGVVGGHLTGSRQADARQGYDAHRARRDALVRTVADLGASPAAEPVGYTLPFSVTGPESAARLAAYVEEHVAGAYGDVVRTALGGLRQDAASAMRDAAVRAVRWRGGSVAFPGLAERG